MYCKDNVLKENWDVKRGDLYVIGAYGSTPRRAKVEISVVLWPEKKTETTRWYMVAPRTLDITGKDAATDVIVRDKRDIGRPYAVTLAQAHMVTEDRLIAYAGNLPDRTMNRIIRQMKDLLFDYCELEGGKEHE